MIISEGFTKIGPSILCIIIYVHNYVLNGKSNDVNLPVGFVDTNTYSGLVVTVVVLFAILKFNQIPNFNGIIGISL